ncbi:MAG: hypothetical protein NTW87_30455 [Planctomycetota bacterium]|nr:hypothetical protein [Planctomycetota bacterium]
MPCETSIAKEDDCLRVLVTGMIDLEAGKQLARTAHAACIQHQCPRVLIDARGAAQKLSIVDLASLGEFCSLLEPRVFMKTALVLLESQILPDRFFEKVVQNRGVNLQVFTDTGEALTWLRSV